MSWILRTVKNRVEILCSGLDNMNVRVCMYVREREREREKVYDSENTQATWGRRKLISYVS